MADPRRCLRCDALEGTGFCSCDSPIWSPPQPRDIGSDSNKVPDARKIAEAVWEWMADDYDFESGVDELTKVIQEAMK